MWEGLKNWCPSCFLPICFSAFIITFVHLVQAVPPHQRRGLYHVYRGGGDAVCELLLYSPLQLYGLRLGHLSVLWQHDGGILRMGAKAIPHSLCLEKAAGLYGDSGRAVLHSPCRHRLVPRMAGSITPWPPCSWGPIAFYPAGGRERSFASCR